jgi:CheY-like chemotaxis protein/two-component sensor histidine kinase
MSSSTATESHKTAGIQRTLAAMDRQLHYMVRIIDDLLDVSRISRGMLVLRKERVDMVQIVERAVENVRHSFDVRNQSVSVDIDGSVMAWVDPTRVCQIISNLLNNASKYMREGGGVQVQLCVEQQNAVVRVIDGGVGIASEQLNRIFEMFVRLDDAPANREGGLGIGLALARRLAQMHGGTLTVASPGIGQGSTFTLSVPLGVGCAATPSADDDIAGAKPGATPSRSVLIIEDNSDVAETLALWLEEMGHRAAVAQDGAEGLRLIESLRPTVVLCDVGLPGMDGVEVCRHVRRLTLGYRPLMIALTGWGQDEDRKRTREAGFDHHLVKPVRPQLLSTLLTSAPPELVQ